jgi:Regulator of G protein signaling domain
VFPCFLYAATWFWVVPSLTLPAILRGFTHFMVYQISMHKEFSA